MYDRDLFEKLKARTHVDANGCWIWDGPKKMDSRWHKGRSGYGITALWNKETRTQTSLTVHRAMWLAVHGQLFRGRKQFVCHTCDNGFCCNPDHLYIGTPQDNMTDAVSRKRFPHQQRTHCPKGHEYNAENTLIVPNYVYPNKFKRQCRKCKLIKLRVRSGWPMHLAESMPPVPRGRRPVNASWQRVALDAAPHK